jgi:hypothetical protein
MPSPEPSVGDRAAINRTVEAVIRIAVIAGLIGWCFVIARPLLAANGTKQTLSMR